MVPTETSDYFSFLENVKPQFTNVDRVWEWQSEKYKMSLIRFIGSEKNRIENWQIFPGSLAGVLISAVKLSNFEMKFKRAYHEEMLKILARLEDSYQLHLKHINYDKSEMYVEFSQYFNLILI